MSQLERLQQEGVPIAFPDGSSKRVRGWDQAGYGVFYGEGDARNYAASVPQAELQMNNRGELRAVLHVLHALPPGERTSIVMDSEHVFKGLTEHLLRWERAGWVVAHADLWRLVLGLLRHHHRRVSFHWVPSHVGLERTGGAGREAERGHVQHPYNEAPSVESIV